jgi:hypothetical protein
VQPIVSKYILPWFGGSAAVWSICTVFFQVVLLIGYAYSDWTTRHFKPHAQAALHILLLAVSLPGLPVIANSSWKPTGNEDAALRILLLLTATVGLPYFLLSTTGPLIQAWISRTPVATQVYRFFSLSNLASLVALICYPFLLEPRTTIQDQADAWSFTYIAFTISCMACALYFLRYIRSTPIGEKTSDLSLHISRPPQKRLYFWWLALPALASWLLLSITNHITQNIAPIPFLRILPLTIYLLTFVLCFESDRWYSRSRFLIPVAVALAMCGYGLQYGFPVKTAIFLYIAGLFFFCMLLHGELARMRPMSRYLTRFYLMMSMGGALGGILVGLIAPRVLPGYYELGIGFVFTALLAGLLPDNRKAVVAGALALVLLSGYFTFKQISMDFENARVIERNFYGTLSTEDVHRDNPAESVRQLYHGSVRHGEQYLDPSRRREPTAYFGPNSGIGLAIANIRSSDKKIGVIRLGAGTLAVYGRPGDIYRFYEINPQVIDVAEKEFTFLRDSEARIETILGDARLALEKESANAFDVLAVDAFSGDAVPVHLITVEAMASYLRHMRPQGIIAFHVTNRYIRLAPVVQEIAFAHGLHAVLIHDEAVNTKFRATDWVLVARDKSVFQQDAIRHAASPIQPIQGLKVWTDNFNNLFRILK